MDFGIQDKRVLIVGGSKNIGAAIAKAFADEGCKLSLVSRNEDKLKSIIEGLSGGAGEHDYIAADLREQGAPTQISQEFLARHKGFDIVVHCVGGALGQKDCLGAVENWEAVWKFNVGIAIEMNAILIPVMRQKKWGRVIHISSISAELGDPLQEPYGGALPYAASKSYLNAYVKGLGKELAKDNVVVTALMPGVVLSEGKYWDKLQKENPVLVKEFLDQYYPIGRFAKPEEIAPFAVFMGSEQASYAAGSIVPISGGRI